MRQCIFPGTFDPVTCGHIDIINRASKIFDRVTVLLLINHKKTTLFNLDDRMSFLKKSLTGKNLIVNSYDGLLTEYCEKINCYNVIRGIRNGVDFEYEMQYFGINRILSSKIEMFFLPTSKDNLYVSSSNVRELILHNRSVKSLVPDVIIDDVVKIRANE